jgi:hypothetical protein
MLGTLLTLKPPFPPFHLPPLLLCVVVQVLGIRASTGMLQLVFTAGISLAGALGLPFGATGLEAGAAASAAGNGTMAAML